MKSQIIVAGHGGQGVLELANYLGYFEMLKGRHVAYTPSYGPESRGGKVKCYVISSEEEIDSPVVEEPDCLIVMNIPSMEYVPLLRKGGLLILNSSLIPDQPIREDVKVLKVPATEIADHLENSNPQILDTKIAANCVMLGAYLSSSGEDLDKKALAEVFQHFLTERKAGYVPLDLLAVERGYEYVRNVPLASR
ncbi:MAG TPA: 2-oxoacid:acceptor oxidoreductase family protein [Nitrososphaerales archaeon]|nr:2-oxoacid:acceptor oxidoreductase family protein [Nitrososphaerales archaeon]